MYSPETVRIILAELKYLQDSLKRIRDLSRDVDKKDVLHSIETVAMGALNWRYK
jgi:hypothetical protein